MDAEKFFNSIRHLPFRGSLTESQVDGVNDVLACWDKWSPGADPRFKAYSLATDYHETARTMQPIEEIGKGRGHSYGVPAGPWSKVFDGRGYVQETWLANYAFATKRLHQLGIIGLYVDLVHTPELMLTPAVAGPTMIIGITEGWFTHHKLADYFDAHHSDPKGARRVINGQNCANLIAGYYDNFLAALQAAA